MAMNIFYKKLILLTLIVSVFNTLPDNTKWVKIINKSRANFCLKREVGGAPIKTIACDNTTAFQWKIKTGMTGFYNVMSRIGNGLDVPGSSSADDANIINWGVSGTGGNNQNFEIVAVPSQADVNEYFYIKNKNSSKCIWINPDNSVTFVNPVQRSCPDFENANVTAEVKGQFLFYFVEPTLTIVGEIRHGNTPDVLLWGSTTLQNLNVDRTVQLTCTDKTDSTNTCTGTVDKTASTYSVNIKPSIDDNVDRIYEIKINVDGYQEAKINVAVRTVAVGPTDATKLLVSPNEYLWTVELRWTSQILDLDLYVLTPENELVFYGYKKSTNNMVNFNNPDLRSIDNSKSELIVISPNHNGVFKIYVKNYSKNAKLKDSLATVRISRTFGASTIQNDYTIPTADHNEFFYYWNVISIRTDYQMISNVMNGINEKPTSLLL
jgi:hypothetical protein